MLEIWGRENSVNVQKALWCAAEAGVAYERIDAGGAFGRTDEPAYRKNNPTGLIPTLVDDDFVLWESNAIVRYLAREYAPGSLMPKAPHEAALADQWMDWQTAEFWPAFRPVFIGLIRTSAEERDDAAIADSVAKTGRWLAMLDAQLARHDYILGNQLTVADIALGPGVHRWFTLPIERPELPALAAWYERLCERAAFQRLVVNIVLS